MGRAPCCTQPPSTVDRPRPHTFAVGRAPCSTPPPSTYSMIMNRLLSVGLAIACSEGSRVERVMMRARAGAGGGQGCGEGRDGCSPRADLSIGTAVLLYCCSALIGGRIISPMAGISPHPMARPVA